MLFRSLTLFPLLALTAQCFLLPSSIEGEAEEFDIVNTIANTHLLKLDCPGCLFAESDGPGKGYHWDENVENSLFLNFTVSRENPEVLALNGVQLYPIQVIPPPVSALQLPSSVSLPGLSTMITASNGEDTTPFTRLRLSYEFTVRPKRSSPTGDNFEVLLLKLRILGIEGKPVTGLDTVEMTLLKSPSNRLYIGALDKTETNHDQLYPSPSAQKAGEEKECVNFPLLCKWRAILGNKISGMKSSLKGCHKFRLGHPKVGGHSGRPGKHHGHHGHHGSQGYRGHHHHHHDGHRWGKFLHQLKRVAAHILVPVFIGIAAGMAASALGMAAGLLVLFLWKKLYRGGSRGSYSVVQQSEDYQGDSKVVGQLDDKDLPEYEEVVVTGKTDGKD
ncbi:hypothetical protein GP486_002400 [Trichoglossum hirsutum]|uniref:DUF7728 domain-containing protein n=1 Tax=Trichoglossum hirsutum TaxID=265104 RepID=A0A9P8LF03_9PEZI|nr:hypothetical protein GP486_002400 [Trichoglossum hirsutum]